VLAKDWAGAIADLRYVRRQFLDAGNADSVAKLDQAISSLIAQSHAAASPTPAPRATPHG
jgi:hypothetical protein